MNFDHDTLYDDVPLSPDSDDLESSEGSGNWDFVPPDDSQSPVGWWSGSGLSTLYLSDDVPEQFRKLLEIISHDNWTIIKNKAFYFQARMMADYDDHSDIVPFLSYFPTYCDMSISQLRSYFTIRTLLRLGKTPDVPLSYIFVYIYELLMKIGCQSAEDAYGRLHEILDNYGSTEPSIKRYLSLWLRDFVVYNNLTDFIPEVFSEERDIDAKAKMFSDLDNVAAPLLFQTAVSLSNYSITQGALYKKHPKEVESAVPYVIRAVAPVVEQQLHHRFETLCFGLKRQVSHRMFPSAVFYDPKPVLNQEVVISHRRRFICKGGLWTESAFTEPSGRKGELMGKILHETDRCLRIVLKSGPKITQQPLIPAVKTAIAQAVVEWKQMTEVRQREVKVDFSKLNRIRNDAEVVRDALLTDEEREDEAVATVIPESPSLPDEDSSTVFTPDEKQFLQELLHGGDWQGFLRDKHILPGVMVDNINGKGMDWMGDILLEDNGEEIQVIEDYLDDVEKEISK